MRLSRSVCRSASWSLRATSPSTPPDRADCSVNSRLARGVRSSCDAMPKSSSRTWTVSSARARDALRLEQPLARALAPALLRDVHGDAHDADDAAALVPQRLEAQVEGPAPPAHPRAHRRARERAAVGLDDGPRVGAVEVLLDGHADERPRRVEPERRHAGADPAREAEVAVECVDDDGRLPGQDLPAPITRHERLLDGLALGDVQHEPHDVGAAPDAVGRRAQRRAAPALDPVGATDPVRDRPLDAVPGDRLDGGDDVIALVLDEVTLEEVRALLELYLGILAEELRRRAADERQPPPDALDLPQHGVDRAHEIDDAFTLGDVGREAERPLHAPAAVAHGRVLERDPAGAPTVAMSLNDSPLSTRVAFSTIQRHGQRPRSIERPSTVVGSMPMLESPLPSASRTTPLRSSTNAASGAWRSSSRSEACSVMRSFSPVSSERSSMCASRRLSPGLSGRRLTDVRNERGAPAPTRKRCLVVRLRPSRATARQSRATRGQSSASNSRRQQPGLHFHWSTGSPTSARVAALASSGRSVFASRNTTTPSMYSSIGSATFIKFRPPKLGAATTDNNGLARRRAANTAPSHSILRRENAARAMTSRCPEPSVANSPTPRERRPRTRRASP